MPSDLYMRDDPHIFPNVRKPNMLPSKSFPDMIIDELRHLAQQFPQKQTTTGFTYADVRDSMKDRYKYYHTAGASGWPSHISMNLRRMLKAGKLTSMTPGVEPCAGSSGGVVLFLAAAGNNSDGAAAVTAARAAFFGIKKQDVNIKSNSSKKAKKETKPVAAKATKKVMKKP